MKMRRSIASEIRRGRRPQGTELTVADLGRELSDGEGFGPVSPIDVGRRVWVREYGLVMENDEQRDRRLGGLRRNVSARVASRCRRHPEILAETGHFRYELDARDDLIIRATRAGRAAARAAASADRSQFDWWDVLFGDLTGEGWDPVPPQVVGALTEAPIVSDDSSIDDDGEWHVGRAWWYPNYMIDDPVAVVAERGWVRFQNAENA